MVVDEDDGRCKIGQVKKKKKRLAQAMQQSCCVVFSVPHVVTLEKK